MSKVILINDMHFGVRGDGLYMLDYQQKFFEETFFPYLVSNSIKTVLIGGDVFDRRKYINFVTLKKTREMFFNELERLNIKTYIIPGNHDTYFKNINDVNSIQLLLTEYDNITYIDKPRSISFGDCSIDMIPWICEDNYDECMSFVQESQSPYLYGHLEFHGFEYMKGIVSDHGMNHKLFSKFKQVWSGHYHHKSQKDNIYYLGAPMEFTFADCDLDRGFHVFDTDAQKIEFIKNPFRLHEKIYYNDETSSSQKEIKNFDYSTLDNKIVKIYVTKKTKPALFDFFIEKCYNRSTVSLSVLEDFSEFHSDNVEMMTEINNLTTKQLMESYIDGIETNINKDDLKSIMSSLYVEALHVNTNTNE